MGPCFRWEYVKRPNDQKAECQKAESKKVLYSGPKGRMPKRPNYSNASNLI